MVEPAEALVQERDVLLDSMLRLAGGDEVQLCVANSNELRFRANSLALREHLVDALENALESAVQYHRDALKISEMQSQYAEVRSASR